MLTSFLRFLKKVSYSSMRLKQFHKAQQQRRSSLSRLYMKSSQLLSQQILPPAFGDHTDELVVHACTLMQTPYLFHGQQP